MPSDIETSGIQATHRERPIIFSGEMVKAILAGTKTQTRRIIANEARGADRVIWISKEKGRLVPGRKDEPYEGWAAQVDKLNGLHLPLNCPYGVAGDRLWVREKWAHERQFDHLPPSQIPQSAHDTKRIKYGCDMISGWYKTRPSIHMPRWASRITLGITKVRVERLQDISEEDAKAEGMTASEMDKYPTARENYADLWGSLHGKDAWDKNPFVWVLEFRRIEP